jgi:hypothetical protein
MILIFFFSRSFDEKVVSQVKRDSADLAIVFSLGVYVALESCDAYVLVTADHFAQVLRGMITSSTGLPVFDKSIDADSILHCTTLNDAEKIIFEQSPRNALLTPSFIESLLDDA